MVAFLKSESCSARSAGNVLRRMTYNCLQYMLLSASVVALTTIAFLFLRLAHGDPLTVAFKGYLRQIQQ